MERLFQAAAARCKRSLCLLLAFCVLAAPAAARTWEVGSTRAITGPGAASRVVRDGDTVIFDPGIYRECAIWRASNLTLEARRPPSSMNQTIMTQTIITGPPCADRGLFVFLGNDITVRGMSFQHAQDTWHTGAGILMEGGNLTVEHSNFVDNENGILAGGPPSSVVRIRWVLFKGNGSCLGPCAHALYVGAQVARLEVASCRFLDTHVGHGIKSRARATSIRDTRIEDGPTGTSSYLIELPDGGDAEIVNNTLSKGINSENRDTVISFGTEDARNPTHELVVRGNRFTNELADPVRFVRNMTQTPARLTDNILTGRVIPLEGPGTVTSTGQ